MFRITIILLLLFIAGRAFSQLEEMIIPSDLKQQTIITEPATLNKGFFRVGINSTYGTIDRVFDESGKKSYIMGSNGWASQWLFDLNLTYGISDRIEIMIQIPYLYEKMYYAQELIDPGSDVSIINTIEADAIGLSDLSFGTEFQIIKEDITKPSLSFKVFVTLPTGEKNPKNIVDEFHYDRPTGYGETTLDFGLQFRKIIYPYSFSFYSWYLYHFEGKKIFKPGEEAISFKSGDRLYFGASANIHLNDWIALMNQVTYTKYWDDEYYGITGMTEGVSISNRWGINYEPSLVFQIRRFRFYEVMQLPVYGKNFMSADPQYILGLQYIF